MVAIGFAIAMVTYRREYLKERAALGSPIQVSQPDMTARLAKQNEIASFVTYRLDVDSLQIPES